MTVVTVTDNMPLCKPWETEHQHLTIELNEYSMVSSGGLQTIKVGYSLYEAFRVVKLHPLDGDIKLFGQTFHGKHTYIKYGHSNIFLTTVNSCYSGQPWDCYLVFFIEIVCNSRV